MNVSFEMEDEQVNAIVVRVLEDHIVYVYTDVPWHSDDPQYNENLKEAFWVVLDYFAGEDAAKNFKNSIEGEKDEV